MFSLDDDSVQSDNVLALRSAKAQLEGALIYLRRRQAELKRQLVALEAQRPGHRAPSEKFVELKPFPQIGYSAQLTPLLTQGQIAMAPIDIGEIVPLKQRGVPLDFVVPEEGMMVIDHSFSILTHGDDKETAAKYIDFVLSPEIQLFMAKEWLIAPTNAKAPLPAELEALPLTPAAIAKARRFDWTAVNKLTPDLAAAWSKAV